MVIGNTFQYGFSGRMGYAVQTSLTARESVTTANIEFLNESLNAEKEPLYVSSMRGVSRSKHTRLQGNMNVGGSIETYVYHTHGSQFLKYCLGGQTSTIIGATNAYTHTFYPTETIPSDTLTALTVCVQRGETYWDYIGCKVNQYTLRAEAGMPLVASIDLIGYDAVNDSSTALTDGYTDTSPFHMAGLNTFIASYGDSLSNLSTTTITRFEVSINNNLITDGSARQLGSNKLGVLQGNMRDIDVTIQQRFDTTTNWDDFIAGTRKAWQFELRHPNTAGTGGTQCALMIKLPHCYYDGAPVNISGEGPILVDYTLKAIYDSTTAYDINMVLVNTQTTIA